MAEHRHESLQVLLVEEQLDFTLDQLAHACGVGRERMQELVAEGLLEPRGSTPANWRFSGSALPRARKALRLARELSLNLSAAALVLDLLAEIEALRARAR